MGDRGLDPLDMLQVLPVLLLLPIVADVLLVVAVGIPIVVGSHRSSADVGWDDFLEGVLAVEDGGGLLESEVLGLDDVEPDEDCDRPKGRSGGKRRESVQVQGRRGAKARGQGRGKRDVPDSNTSQKR